MKYVKYIFVILGALTLLLTFWPLTARFNQPVMLSADLRDSLIKSGVLAAKNGDVPVAAIITYNDSIIGSGYNDVVSRNNAGGHAEINALSKAISAKGFEAFMKLDRKKLRLITTFEPCAMCRGAIAQYRIHDVYILKYKSLTTHWYDWSQQVRSYLNSVPVDEKDLQDSLFRLHPGFDETKAVY